MICDDEPAPGLMRAYMNMRRAQQRLDCYPEWIVEINGEHLYLGRGTRGRTKTLDDVPRLKCTLDPELLERILRREVHFNSAELACLIRFHRDGPYNPDVHLLLSFLHE